MKMSATYATFCSAKPATATTEAQPECVFVKQTFFPSGKQVQVQLVGADIALVPAAILEKLKEHDGVQCTTVQKVAESRQMPLIPAFTAQIPADWTARPTAEEPRLVDGQLVIEPTAYWLNSPAQQAAFESKRALAEAPDTVLMPS